MVLQRCCHATLQAACMTSGLSENETCGAMMRAIEAVYAAHMLPAAQPASAPAKAVKASAKAGSRARAGHADAVASQPPQVWCWRSSCSKGQRACACPEACMISGIHPGRLACYRKRGCCARARLDRTGSAARGGHPCAVTPARPATAWLASGLFAHADFRCALCCMFCTQRVDVQHNGTVVIVPQAWML